MWPAYSVPGAESEKKEAHPILIKLPLLSEGIP